MKADYARAKELNEALAEIIETSEFEDPLARGYLDIVLAAADDG